MPSRTRIVLAARDEEQRIGATLEALAQALPGAEVWVADDGSRDATAAIAARAGARTVSRPRARGKGAAMSEAAAAALAEADADAVFLLCDGDLGQSAVELGELVAELERSGAQLAVACFARREGGGLGVALRFARWAVRRRCGLELMAPLSGQRALTRSTLEACLPFAPGYGMEPAMTIDAVRAGARVVELELDLSHRASRRTPRGFAHRARQLLDCLRAYASRG